MKAKNDKMKWRILEYLNGDFCDSSENVEFHDVPKKKIRQPSTQSRKKKQIVYVEKEGEPGTSVSTEVQTFSPELDTCRVYFDCGGFVNLERFIPESASRKVRSVIRSATGDIYDDCEFYRNEMSNSWWGKMTITQERKKFGTHGKNSISVLSFEFSVAKWWHYSSGVNSGEEPCAKLILLPCIQAMYRLGIQNYSRKGFRYIVQKFCERAEIRRFDLSLNFDVPISYTPSDYVSLLSRCYLNRQVAEPYSYGSISFGSDKSPYRVIWYDKEKEQKHYYTSKDKRPSIHYWEAEDGSQFKDRPADWKEKKYSHKVFDFNAERIKFYKANKDLFKNKLRFEIQYRTKFIQENNLMSCGMKEIDNVIRLGVLYWRKILDQFDEQLNRGNFDYTDDEKEPVCRVLNLLDERRQSGLYSRTKSANMSQFIQDCYKRGWKSVRDDLGSSLFCQNAKWVRTELDYDVKVLNKQCPIMCSMLPYIVSREGRMIRDFSLVPSPIQRCAV